MKATLVLALFIAIVGRLMADEIKAWSGWLHESLRRKAVAKLPTEYRDRYDEEWAGGIEEAPGEIFKLIYSLGLLRAAVGLRNASLKSALQSDKDFYLLWRRTFDLVFSSLLLAYLSPLLLSIAIAIRLESPGPVLYFSERIGKKGCSFRCVKFRTMVCDASKNPALILRAYDQNGLLIKATSDPRITRLGRFLRKFSLDELPQFINVLKGEMSIVGPRPPLASEVLEYKLNHLRRLDVTPGVTGLWQVQARRDPSFDSYISLDVTYIENWSLMLDLKIIARTVAVVLAGTGS